MIPLAMQSTGGSPDRPPRGAFPSQRPSFKPYIPPIHPDPAQIGARKKTIRLTRTRKYATRGLAIGFTCAAVGALIIATALYAEGMPQYLPRFGAIFIGSFLSCVFMWHRFDKMKHVHGGRRAERR